MLADLTAASLACKSILEVYVTFKSFLMSRQLRCLIFTLSILAPASLASAQERNFSGPYFGGSLGGTFGDIDFTHVERTNGGAFINSERFSTSPDSFSGGVQVGYNHRIGNFILGIEGSFIATDADDQQRTDLNGVPRNRQAVIQDQLGLAGRFGYTRGSWLVYGKLGIARSSLEFHNIQISDGTDLGMSSTNETGFLFGGGFEYAISKNLSVGFDYTGVDFNVDNTNMRDPVTGAVFTTSNDDIDLTTHTVAVRLNVRFGGSGHEATLK